MVLDLRPAYLRSYRSYQTLDIYLLYIFRQLFVENNRLFRNDKRTFYIPFHLLMNYLTITLLGKTYDKLIVYKDYYRINPNRTYFGIEDEDEQEPGHFCDLSENHPDIPDSEIFGRLPGHEAIIIDNDFLMCFNSPREAKIWIKDNIPECVITGDIDGRDCFYIKKDKPNGRNEQND